MRADSKDPRSIVTSDAFQIDPELLGMPLAAPSRRLWAIGIDFALVGILTSLLSNVQLLLWGVIALVLVRLAFTKAKRRTVSQAAGVLMRASAGCLGVSILSGVLIAWGISRMDRGDREEALGRVIERGAELAPPEMRRDLTNADYRGATTPDEVLRVMRRAAARMGEAPPAVRRRLLEASVPPDAAWAPQADSLIAIALGGAAGGARAPDAMVDPVAARSVASLSDAEVLEALGNAERNPSGDVAREQALRSRATEILAADTLRALGRQVEDLHDQLDAEKQARADTDEELKESRSGVSAFASLLRDMWKQLGSAVGLWSLYFTVLTSIWRGQTIGKRLMRVRVLRLDGEPIGWWSAFERAGGYVAGLATGLLGFAQVLWDPNRQCIHDKIVGTVVVVDGAQRVEGAWGRRTTA